MLLLDIKGCYYEKDRHFTDFLFINNLILLVDRSGRLFTLDQKYLSIAGEVLKGYRDAMVTRLDSEQLLILLPKRNLV